MINLKVMLNDIYNVMSKQQTFFEFILNLTFILIILIIATIFYWDNINRTIIKNGRCKITLNNEDVIYNLQMIDKTTNSPVLNISYDNTNNHNAKIECVCPTGNRINDFKQIPLYNYDLKQVEIYDKYCHCDDDYRSRIISSDDGLSIQPSNIIYDGDAFLVDYYKELHVNRLGGNVDKNFALSFPN
jgi:hypothetical protein